MCLPLQPIAKRSRKIPQMMMPQGAGVGKHAPERHLSSCVQAEPRPCVNVVALPDSENLQQLRLNAHELHGTCDCSRQVQFRCHSAGKGYHDQDILTAHTQAGPAPSC